MASLVLHQGTQQSYRCRIIKSRVAAVINERLELRLMAEDYTELFILQALGQLWCFLSSKAC